MIDQLVGCVIRPPRAEYIPEIDLIGPSFKIKGRKFQRIDLELVNARGHTLQCSHYVPCDEKESTLLPCVIYCHGNSGCRADANDAVMLLLPYNITVFAVDFSGSGISGGEYVTLGAYEKDDLATVVDYLRVEAKTSLIGLWGRSMGAVTSILYGSTDPSIAGMVVDSPFSNLYSLMLELCDTLKLRLPKFTLKFAVQYMRKLIKQKAQFDIMDLDTVAVAPTCFIPVLFGHGESDNFILPHHSVDIYNAYAGDKNIIKFEGDHNSPRPNFYFDSVSIFFHNVLHPPEPSNICFTDETFLTQSLLSEASFAQGFSNPNYLQDGFEFDDELDQETIKSLLSIAKKDKNISSSSSSSSSTLNNSAESKTLNGSSNGLSSSYQQNYSPLPSFEKNENKNAVENDLESIIKFSQNQDDGFLVNGDNVSSSKVFLPPEDYDEEKMLMEAIAASLQLSSPTENKSSNSNDNGYGNNYNHSIDDDEKENQNGVIASASNKGKSLKS